MTVAEASRAVLVVGASGAIGSAVCRALATSGYQVWAADLAAPEHVVSELVGDRHRALALDVTDDDAVCVAVRGLWATGEPAGLVYAAGLVATGPVAQLSWSHYDALMNVNLRGAFAIGRAVADLAPRGPSDLSLVYLASVAGLKGEAGGSIYCASKFGLIGFVQSIAAELASSGVRVNAVCPGNVDSPMLRELAEAVTREDGSDTAKVLENFARASAFNRFITPDEVANVCTFLISPLASGVSGQALVVDGPPAT